MRVRVAVLAIPLLIGGCNMDSSPAVEEVDPAPAAGAELVPARQAIQRAAIAGTDLGTMNLAEISKVIDPGSHCSFSYVGGGRPVLVAVPAGNGGARAFVKINGNLVALASEQPASLEGLANGAVFRADVMAVGVEPLHDEPVLNESREAELFFRLEQGVSAGYIGFYTCAAEGLPQGW